MFRNLVDDVLHPLNLQPRYWGNSAGRVAAIQLPLVVALSMKNNPITCKRTPVGRSDCV